MVKSPILAWALFLLALPGVSPQAGPGAADPAGLRVAVVQLEIDEEFYASVEEFQGKIAERVRRCLAFEPDLIVFPEYTGVFVALIPFHEAILGCSTLQEAWTRVRRLEPLTDSLGELFLLNSGFAERILEETFGGLARQYELIILAGSYFACQEGEGGRPELRNRALVFGPGGELVYWQDKVFLTEFESAVLGLSPGELEEAEGFAVDGWQIGLTICRSTFQREWEKVYRGYDLWLDIKANGTAFTQQQARSFERALPARLAPAEVPYGVTACLTGCFLDLFWEGSSSLILLEDGKPRTLWVAPSPRREKIAGFVLAPR